MYKKGSRKAQASVFIIVAIVLVVVVALLIFIRKDSLSSEIDNVSPDVQPIADFVTGCLVKTGEDAIEHIGMTGGYLLPPPENIDDIAVYFDKEDNLAPSKEKVEQELSGFIETFLSDCTRDFEDFPGFEINDGDINADTSIEENLVMFQIRYPLSIRKGDKTYELSQFGSDIRARLNTVLKTTQQITSDQATHPKEICVTCILTLAEENSLKIDMYDLEDPMNTLFIIKDNQTIINGEDYIYNFVNSYGVAS